MSSYHLDDLTREAIISNLFPELISNKIILHLRHDLLIKHQQLKRDLHRDMFQSLSFNGATLSVDYVYLDANERRQMANTPHEYLINQLVPMTQNSSQTLSSLNLSSIGTYQSSVRLTQRYLANYFRDQLKR